MKQDTKKIIKSIKALAEEDKEKIYEFVVLERNKNVDPKTKKLLKFGIKSLNDFRDWEKKAKATLEKSRKFTNELKRQAVILN